MRLFIALDIDDDIRDRLTRFLNDVRDFAPDARWVKPDSLHVTLKFIGEQPEGAVVRIKQTLADVPGVSTAIRFQGYGFFPTAKSARVFWIGMQAGPELAALAAALDDKMAALGIAKEDRRFSPHLTLARSAGASGAPRWRKGDKVNLAFRTLQQILAAQPPPPEFGTMAPREFFLYQSQLSPKGSKYTKLANFALR